jgi:hypothetical protein
METSNSELSADVTDVLELGSVLGQNQAFGLIAGRCSAAQAASLKRLRDEKKYKRVAESWRDFCPRYLRMSGAQADKIIHLWEEFGEGFFKLAQLTRISPEAYRAIAPAVRENALHLNGEVIELRPENAHEVARVVARVRRAGNSQSEHALLERVLKLDMKMMAVVDEIFSLHFEERSGLEWESFVSLVSRAYQALSTLVSGAGAE